MDPIAGNHSKAYTQQQPQNGATKDLTESQTDSVFVFYRKMVVDMLNGKDVWGGGGKVYLYLSGVIANSVSSFSETKWGSHLSSGKTD